MDGPSGDAWGVDLTAPALVTHQGALIAFARAASTATDTLYFQVLDPSAAANAADEDAWNGWYRFEFPEASPPAPENARDRVERTPAELRLAGMDLLTVTPAAATVQPADAAFQVFSDDRFLYVFRPSAHGTLYLTRLMLLSRTEQVSKQDVTRYALELAWEVRYRRSGLLDVPYDETDTQSFLDPTGTPFYEPTLELSQIDGIEGGEFAVARVPSADPSRVVWYVACADAAGVRLFSFLQSDSVLTDFSEPPQTYTRIEPTLANDGAQLPPLAGLAPALLFYAEQAGGEAASGQQIELQRAGRLMLAIAVKGGGLGAATAIYDFSVDVDGGIPDLPGEEQSLPLVDGTIENGAFVPDATSPSFPTPAQAASTVRVVDGLTVDAMLLGQVQPQTDPVLRMGEDGLVHLYYGGPPAEDDSDWNALVPGMPTAMVAQFDPRVSYAVLAVPWRHSTTSEQPAGSVYFNARQSGAVMAGAQVSVSDVSFGQGEGAQAQPDLCTVEVTYPAPTGLPGEIWTGVPRDLAGFAAVLDGAASDDSADPEVVAGNRPFFDFSGELALVRTPVVPANAPPPPPPGPYPPVLTFVSTRSSISLTAVTVGSVGAEKQVVLDLADAAGCTLQQTWAGLPEVVDSYASIFGGSASDLAYGYVPGPGSTPLFALPTDAYGIPAPLLLYPAGGGPDVSALEIEVRPSQARNGTLDVDLDLEGKVTAIIGVPAGAADFAAALNDDPGFQGLALRIDVEGVSGDVLPTEGAVGAVDLRGAAVLFDLVGSAQEVSGLVAGDAAYAAGRVSHAIEPRGEFDSTRLIGFIVTYDEPDAGASAYVVDLPSPVATDRADRELIGRGDAAAPQSGAWMRQTPPEACAFDGSNSVEVPVTIGGEVAPQSACLRPQWDWTLEAWLRPSSGEDQRLATFHDGAAETTPYAPQLDYRIDLAGAEVLQFGSYAKRPQTPDSSFFRTSSSPLFLPDEGGFTWEVWVRPLADPVPIGGNPAPLGGVIEVGGAEQKNASFSVGLDAKRQVVLRIPKGNETEDLTSKGAIPVDPNSGLPQWTHLAVTAAQGPDGKWKLALYLDATLDSSFEGVTLQSGNPAPSLTIGRNTIYDVSMFGKLANLRLWGMARSEAEIRGAALTALVGSEAGLLGCWPLAQIEKGSLGHCTPNIARATGSAWSALQVESTQPVTTVVDDVFLGVVGSVAGLPPVSAQAMLVSDRWNHLAVVFSAGGALALNTAPDDGEGEFDWMRASGGELTPAASFAIDAWIAIPAKTAAPGTIAALWAWDEAPEDQSYLLQVDSDGNLVFTVKLIVDEEGTVSEESVASSGVDLADGQVRHVAAVFTAIAADGSVNSTASYEMSLLVDGRQVGVAKEKVKGQTVQVQPAQVEFLAGRSNLAPEEADPQPVEDLELLRGVLGRLRFWGTSPSLTDLFPEDAEETGPGFGPPKGLVAEWGFRDREGTVAADSIGGNDGELSSSAPWSSMGATSTLTFLANGKAVASVKPQGGGLSAVASQFSLGAPVETGVRGFAGELGRFSLWGEARSPETIRQQMQVPLVGDERDLLACWDFSAGGTDITGGGNDASPPIAPSRIEPSTAPVTNEGGAILNAYGGEVGELTASTPGRIGVGAYVDVQRAGGLAAPLAVLKRQYVFDPLSPLGEGIQVGTLDLVYVGQVQTRPTLVGYIEGAPPVPSENLTRPFYLSGQAYANYNGTAAVALVQRNAEQVAYTSNIVTSGEVDLKTMFGGGIKSAKDATYLVFSQEFSNIELLAQAVFAMKLRWGTEESERLSADWTAEQRDEAAVTGDWEPFEQDGGDYLSPLVGRRFVPANLGYALVESLTADLYAAVFHATGAAVGTIAIPDPGIPPDRNVLRFPIDPEYVKAGTLDGKVGLANDPSWADADRSRGSYFRPTEAYALAASIEQAEERSRSYASQFNWSSRGQSGRTDLGEARRHLPVDFDQGPGEGEDEVVVPKAGIANRYVWTSSGGLHAERYGYAAAVTRTYVGFTERTFRFGTAAKVGFFLWGVGWQASLDLMGQHAVAIRVGVGEEAKQSVDLEVRVQGESYLHRWDPKAPGPYGGSGAFEADQAPGKVTAYRFMTLLLPSSRANGATFERIVDPVWRRLSNEPVARSLRELRTPNPAWRVLHRVTYVERVPPPVSSRSLYAVADDVREPVNLAGNADLLRLIATALGVASPTPANIGAAVAAVLDPAPTGPGQYPASVLEGIVPWWRGFLDSARPGGDGAIQDQAAATLLTEIVTDVVEYVVAGYRSGVIQSPPT